MSRALRVALGVAAGIGLMLTGAVYGVLFVGIPYHDAPPPELRAADDFHADVAGALWNAGLGIVLVTVLLGCALWMASAITRVLER